MKGLIVFRGTANVVVWLKLGSLDNLWAQPVIEPGAGKVDPRVEVHVCWHIEAGWLFVY